MPRPLKGKAHTKKVPHMGKRLRATQRMGRPVTPWDKRAYKISISVPLYLLMEAEADKEGVSHFFVQLYHYKYGDPLPHTRWLPDDAVREKVKRKRGKSTQPKRRKKDGQEGTVPG